MNLKRQRVIATSTRTIEMIIAAFCLGDTWSHVIGIFFALSVIAPFIPDWWLQDV